MRGRRAAVDNRERLAFDRCAEGGDEFRCRGRFRRRPRATPIRHRAWPQESRVIAGSASIAVDGVRLRLDLAQLHACGARWLDQRGAAGFRHRQDRDAATVGFGAREDVVGGADTRIPACGGRPAVVDQQHERAWRRRMSRPADSTAGPRRRGSPARQARAAAASATTACAPASLPSARCRTAAASAGSRALRGRGGISRSSHHSTGRLSRPSSTSGCAKPRGRPPIMPRSRLPPAAPSGSRRHALRPCGRGARAGVRSPGGRCDGW